MLTFIKNIPTIIVVLYRLGWKAPKALAIIGAILAVIGTEQFQKLIEALGVATEKEADKLPVLPESEPEKARFLDRVRHRFVMNQLGMSERTYVAFCKMQGISGDIPSEQIV